MSDCVTVSDATILYCSDIECTENTCYAAVDVVVMVTAVLTVLVANELIVSVELTIVV